ncbi:molybdopterin-dependent oxidoreductase [Pseudoteredinibacter isoporae]|uniref:molybdopterin-dependent oxidoreductase n=1 Tax=Pseudoteredinibacter isoporae TaxID=570281 RepID=UPI00333F7D2A
MMAKSEQANEEWHSTACNLCFVNCGIQLKLGGDNERQILKVRGDKDHPTSQGYICNKASRLDYYQNSQARISSPMRRTADGRYEAVDWDTAIGEIAGKLQAIRDEHGGDKILYYGGGGQGNHLGGAYATSLRKALGIRYKSSAISQEKTGLSWVFSRMIGGLVHPEVHHAKVAMFVGKNPFMSNGLDRARLFLKEIKKDPERTLIVIDPRRSETADHADIHLAVRPGRDAWCLGAILAHIVQSDLLPMDWLAEHASGYEKVIERFKAIDVDRYAEFAGISPSQVRDTAEIIAKAESFALEEDIGVQMAPHSTLVTYLNFLLMLMNGNYGKPGTMGMFTQLAEMIAVDYGPVDENGYETERRTLPVTGAPIVSGLFPANYLTEEILNEDPRRPRALIVESSNPVHSLSDAKRMRKALRHLDFSLAIDVVMSETALECDYVLPASSQYEKWEATFFPRNFPANIFYLREPVLKPMPNTLGEPEMHARLLEALAVFEDGELDSLKAAAQTGLAAYQGELFTQMGSNRKIASYLPYVLYRTLGPALPAGQEATAAIWGLCQMYVLKHSAEAARAGFSGPTAGSDLFQALVDSPTAVEIGVSTYEESWARIPHPDNKLQMLMGELLDEVDVLDKLEPLHKTSDEYPFALVAGVRRAYTANCNIRDPQWAKGRAVTALTMHPEDAQRFGLEEGKRVLLETETGQAEVELAYDERMHLGTISVPNGQGMRFVNENNELEDTGVYVNELTSVFHRDRFIGTPLHKFVPARVSAC